MKAERRAKGKLVRKILKLDRAWKAKGRQEGRTENDLAWNLGQALRAGIGYRKLDRARMVNG
jgi:hypothetical protein